jgi:hypothetical protein
MIKNKAITAVHYFATDSDGPKTGDVGNHAMKVIGDGTLGGITASPAEVDATNAPGIYKIALSAAENNYDFVTVAGKSSTSGVTISPISWTNTANVEAINGNEDVPVIQEAGALAMQTGELLSGSTTGLLKAASGTLSSVDDFYNNRFLIFTSGSLKGQGRRINDYTGSSKQFQIDGVYTSAGGTGDDFIIV